jgi:hypothetical protein
VRTRTPGGTILFHGLPEQVFIDRAENFLGQVHGADLRSAQIVDINRCHMLSLVWGAHFCTSTLEADKNVRVTLA